MKNAESIKQQGDVIWSIANLLRGPYRPPQYRRVMIPLTVLRRLDCVLEVSKDKVVAHYKKLKAEGKVDVEPLLAIVREHCEAYLKAEVLPYRADAWIDHGKIKVGYEIPFNRHFYEYEAPRPLADIEKDIETLEKDIMAMLKEVTA